MQTDNLASIKDDMVAFIAGNGLRQMNAYIPDEVPSVLFEEDNPDGWKDFVEHAKAAGAVFVTMSDVTLEKRDIELLVRHLQEQSYPDPESPELADAQELLKHVGKTGFVQLGFAHQGMMFLFETETQWYAHFQAMLEAASEIGRIVLDEDDES